MNRPTKAELRKLEGPLQAVIVGYRVISRKHGIIARIDRHDWQKHCKELHPNSPGVWDNADWYRRCVSQDTLVVPISWQEWILNSGQDHTGFVPFPDEMEL